MPETIRITYTCGKCGGKNVQIRFPVWVDANDIDNKDKYELDCEAQPEKDSDMIWCLDCEGSTLLVRKEEKTGGREIRR